MDDLCEVGERESDNNGHQRALAGTDDLAHVDGDLAIGRLRGHDGTIGAVGRVCVSVIKS